jgi:hypothetical protein
MLYPLYRRQVEPQWLVWSDVGKIKSVAYVQIETLINFSPYRTAIPIKLVRGSSR